MLQNLWLLCASSTIPWVLLDHGKQHRNDQNREAGNCGNTRHVSKNVICGHHQGNLSASPLRTWVTRLIQLEDGSCRNCNTTTTTSRTQVWKDEDPALCGCHGSGWFLSEVDTIHKCSIHWVGQPHPEDDVCWGEHAVRCLVGFFGRAKNEAPSNPSGSCYHEDPEDNIPF